MDIVALYFVQDHHPVRAIEARDSSRHQKDGDVGSGLIDLSSPRITQKLVSDMVRAACYLSNQLNIQGNSDDFLQQRLNYTLQACFTAWKQ